MNIKKIVSKLFIALAIVGMGVGDYAITSLAGNAYLDVTISGGDVNVTSADPYSQLVSKDDNDQKFYITLRTLTETPTISFDSYRKNDNGVNVKVSGSLVYLKGYLGTTRKKEYYAAYDVGAGNKCYVYAYTDMACTNARAIGTYCP